MPAPTHFLSACPLRNGIWKTPFQRRHFARPLRQFASTRRCPRNSKKSSIKRSKKTATSAASPPLNCNVIYYVSDQLMTGDAEKPLVGAR